MSDESQKPVILPSRPLSEILAEYDRLGSSRKWICGDLALRRFDALDELLKSPSSSSPKSQGSGTENIPG